MKFMDASSIGVKLIMKQIWQTQREWEKPIEKGYQNAFRIWLSELSQSIAIEMDR